MLYPLLFKNNFHSKIWGGHRLKPLKGLPADDEPIGESWEVSAVEGSCSIVDNGPLAGLTLAEISEKYKEQLVGKAVYNQYGTKFPLLVKFIDSSSDLSVQVHPNNTLAKERYGNSAFGKTEMWYILSAEPGAKLYSGFKTPISEYEFEKRVADNTICDVLSSHIALPGDVFYIPAGRVHAIGGGIMLAEIQQSSDVTYRIYDYNRPGLDGKLRELHTDLAKDAIDFNVANDYRTHYEQRLNKPVPIVVNDYFVVKELQIKRSFHRKLFKYDSFVIYMCIAGDCTITINSSINGDSKDLPVKSVTLTVGNTCLIPASVADLNVTPNNAEGNTRVLEVYIDNKNF